jgi:AraC-like DNA-binding protein
MTVQYDDSKSLMSGFPGDVRGLSGPRSLSGSMLDSSLGSARSADSRSVDSRLVDARLPGSMLAGSMLTDPRLADSSQPAHPESARRGDVLSLSKAGGSLLAEVVAISTASSALPSCADADEMLRVAAELARDVIGLSRVGFFMRDPSAERLIFRGTWGTAPGGETKAEHDAFNELSLEDGLALQNLRESGSPALCRSRASWFSVAAAGDAVVASPEVAPSGASEVGSSEEGWVMITPLFAAGHLVGVMYNEASGPHGGEPGKQAAAAVLCGMVAIDYIARRGPVRFQPLGVAAAPSLLVQRIRDAIDENPARRGKDLAVEFGVSPGHLARAFKREMGLSLVDYRNRKRIDRFWDALRRRGRAYSLKQAAFDAGFGSYAQFNRIHKKLVGVGPRLGARRTEAAAYEVRDVEPS